MQRGTSFAGMTPTQHPGRGAPAYVLENPSALRGFIVIFCCRLVGAAALLSKIILYADARLIQRNVVGTISASPVVPANVTGCRA